MARIKAAGVLACDFFTVETVFLKTLYVLFFIEIGTGVHVTMATRNPDTSFVTQQARNVAFDRDDATTLVRFLVRDRDQKFTRSFDEVFKTEGARVKGLSPPPIASRTEDIRRETFSAA